MTPPSAQNPRSSADPSRAPDLAARLDAAEARCLALGERWTPPRARALELLLAGGRPLGAYELLSGFKGSRYTHPPTVYRALDFLVAHGFAHHLRSANRFVACAHAGRPHAPQFLICEGCGRAEEHELAEIEAFAGAASAQGFHVASWTLEVRGLCPRCAGVTAANAQTRSRRRAPAHRAAPIAAGSGGAG